MTYIVNVNADAHTNSQQTYTIDVDTAHNKHEQVKLNGVALSLDWQPIGPLITNVTSEGGRYSLLIAGQSYEVFARRVRKPEEQGSHTYEILLAGQRFEVKVEDERSILLAGLSKVGSNANAASVQAPMPGLVVNILHEVGATVSEGQTVVVLEAMKMENDLSSPITGIIKAILVSKGQTVEQGQILVHIEGATV